MSERDRKGKILEESYGRIKVKDGRGIFRLSMLQKKPSVHPKKEERTKKDETKRDTHTLYAFGGSDLGIRISAFCICK